MKPKEANKIIIKFMNYNDPHSVGYYSFDKSLGKLIPVWEKLSKQIFINICRHDIEDYHLIWFDGLKTTDVYCVENDLSIQESAAIATAKAILELHIKKITR
ncbi:MAG: hypothetical protein ACTSRG_12890 [Candidatus Helarchaeota archaeon]